MKQVLAIAGSDPGGGAGVQADIKAIHANGAFALSALTAVTAQNTGAVKRAFELPVEMVEAQLDAVFADFQVAAVKTGMLSSARIVEAVAGKLRHFRAPELVVDPVILAKSGFRLLSPEGVAALQRELLPLARLVTPNAPEAEVLAGCPVRSLEEAREAARRILDRGCRAVLVKGGHLPGDEAIDLLYDGRNFTLFPAARLRTRNTHGTGCTYAAAIAAQLGRGKNLEAAVGAAKEYLTQAMAHALEIGRGPEQGRGCGPLHHFYFMGERP